MITKTSEEWYKEEKELKVLDADGWDRVNFEYSWYEELITKEEFEIRVMSSTCMNWNTDRLTRSRNK